MKTPSICDEYMVDEYCTVEFEMCLRKDGKILNLGETCLFDLIYFLLKFTK